LNWTAKFGLPPATLANSATTVHFASLVGYFNLNFDLIYFEF